MSRCVYKVIAFDKCEYICVLNIKHGRKSRFETGGIKYPFLSLNIFQCDQTITLSTRILHTCYSKYDQE